ncbi:MAG TPA: hypothetical protein P5264_09995, partial [Mangrovimonas sp.]|nr:hypothetical protein [Mangrovimonas sp.]
MKQKYWEFKLLTNSVMRALEPSSNEYKSNCPPGALSIPSELAIDWAVPEKEPAGKPKTVILTPVTVVLLFAVGDGNHSLASAKG